MQKMLWGREREGETARKSEKAREWREVAAPSRHARLPASKSPAGAGWRSLGGGGVGWRGRQGRRVSTTRTKQRQATGLLCFYVGGERGEQKSCCVLWLQPSTSPRCCCNQRPSVAASEGERLDPLFNSWGLRAMRHHAFCSAVGFEAVARQPLSGHRGAYRRTRTHLDVNILMLWF